MGCSTLNGVPGLSFGRVADEYERARPEYAPAAVDHVAAELGLDSSATVLDLAAGTGKLTRALRARFDHVVAVEPDEAMRAKIGGDARAGRAEAVPLDDGAVDAVFVGDAFHWFDAPTAVAEIRRVLRPGGGLALLWNQWPMPQEPPAVKAVLDATWRRFHGDRTEFESSWQQEIESAFGPLSHATFARRLEYGGDLYAELCITASCPSALPAAERSAAFDELRRHLGGRYALDVLTDVYWVRA